MKLSIQLVTWNGGKYMPFLFESLRNQTYKDWQLYIFDNGSQDDTVEQIKNQLNNFSVHTEFFESKENIGFARAHNQLFLKNNSDYVLLLNQDMYLMADCIAKLTEFLDKNQDAGAVTPKLLKWNFSAIDEKNSLDTSFTQDIDSLGLKVFKNGRVVDIQDSPVGKSAMPVFGVSGALPMYRWSALKNVAYEDETIFDDLYGSYKEDVDLAFRLASAGWKSYTVLDAVAFHDRSAAGPKELKDTSAAKNKQTQSELIKYNSYKNHLMTLYKSISKQNHTLDFLAILWYEFKKFVWFLIYDRKVLSGLGQIWRDRHELARKRAWIRKNRKV
ncbi:MAG: glycosyltransferase family 2 protein [Patescibacteria group bacterium]